MVNPRHTIASQLLENANDDIIYCLASQKGMTDEKRKLFGFVLNILITGNNIDWKIPNSVNVCDILGVGRSSIDYKLLSSFCVVPGDACHAKWNARG